MHPASDTSYLPHDDSITDDIEIIRRHLDAIVRLETCAFDPPWKMIDFMNECDSCDSRYMILLHRDTLAGYLFAKIALDEISLNKICIDTALRGLGYGTILLEHFIRKTKEYSRIIFLEVDSTNTTAIRLYQRFGFRPNRIRKAIYAHDADGIEMVLDLGTSTDTE